MRRDRAEGQGWYHERSPSAGLDRGGELTGETTQRVEEEAACAHLYHVSDGEQMAGSDGVRCMAYDSSVPNGSAVSSLLFLFLFLAAGTEKS